MANAVTPALTPDEWGAGAAQVMMHVGPIDDATERPVQLTATQGEELGFWGVALKPGQPVRLADECAQVLLAFANHALPDDSPYKFTRDDVLALDAVLHGGDLTRITSPADHPRNAILDRVVRLREKLQALLPPE